MKAILGIKKGMTRVFKEDEMVPVTIVDTTSCRVTKKGDGMVELGLLEVRKPRKSDLGQYKKLKFVPRFKKVFKKDLGENIKLGDEIKPDSFEEGEKVTVTSVSKGKGFQGVVKRWGFKGGPRTHGQSDRLRAPGSIGAGTDPGRVWKGKKMGGRMGKDRITLNDREVIGIKDNILLISGPVPGGTDDLIAIFTEN